MRRRFLLALTLALAPNPTTAATVASAGDASITHDAQAGTWSIAAGGATLTLGLDSSRDFEALRLVTTSNKPWTIGSSSDSSVTIDGKTFAFGSRAAGFAFKSAVTFGHGRTLRLDAAFDLSSANLRVTRHYVVASGSPTFETWTTYATLGPAAAKLSNLNGFQFIVPAGAVHWLTGLQGDSADVEHNEAFTLQNRDLAVGERLDLGAVGRSSEQTVPWLAIDGEQDQFYAALMWSGAWSLTASRSSTGLSLSFGLAPMSTTLEGQSIDGPHALFGIVNGGLSRA